ncbi:GNAT family N-acetyltransferase [Cryobacterium sp. 1639]|uniref:GNAT family N-acetyltransferase n=1 Tax=Cryobacterium inferilacus TaxID=2866629 RepID=UPI001C73D2DD|nr:GNAT family N-acetyltransferase [Cryobacterium sp. 1639]MBX0298565.1 GNAT family N-acetyltransferase [Cryobacterium sp. 1639]
MSVQVRPLGDKDFFPWLGLFEGYSEFNKSDLTDEKALRVWSWIIDKNHDLDGAVAVDDNGDFVGFTLYRAFPRTLSGDVGLFIDDLFVTSAVRDSGVSQSLLEFAREYAKAHNYRTLQWVNTSDEKSVRKLYDEVGTRTSWVTYQAEV